jgi:adenylosuccinate lyase
MAPQETQPRERPVIVNTLADRYASIETLNIFSPEHKIIAGRDLWIVVMQAQHDLGGDIPQSHIDDYIQVKNNVNLESIRQRELQLKHDENARIEEFNALAGHQDVHRGQTSRDQSDNVEQMENRNGMCVVRDRAVATLARFARLALENAALVYAGRTHLVAAQSNLIGKLFSDAGEELLVGFDRLETLIDKYPLRGIKGAMGTQTDMLQYFNGDAGKVEALENRVAESLGFKHILRSVGQIYPRSLDFEVVTALYEIVCGPASLAWTMRQMASREEYTEGFKEGQVGSSAMPHKMNMRTAERIKGLKNILAGHVTMAMMVAGEQLYGGDVSDSSTRRILLPDAFFATDGIFQSMLTVLDEGGFFPAVINAELERYLPFLTTTRLLTAALKHGVGRETAHRVIKKHAVAVALEMRKGQNENNLLERLAKDQELGLTREQLDEALANPIEFVGTAPQQILDVVARINTIVAKYPEAAAYMPEDIL